MKIKQLGLALVLISGVIALQGVAASGTQAKTIHPQNALQEIVLAPSIADLTSFTARVVNGGNVRVKWQTGTEYSLMGFNLYRKAKNADSWEKLNKNLMAPKGAGTLQGSLYAFTDKQLQSGKKYQYRLEMLGIYGNSAYSDIVTVKLQ